MTNVFLYYQKNCLSPTAPDILAWGRKLHGTSDYICRIPIEVARKHIATYDERCWRQAGQIMIESRAERRAQSSEAA